MNICEAVRVCWKGNRNLAARHRKLGRMTALALLAYLGCAVSCLAQGVNASLGGTVADGTGAVLPQVAVAATNADTKVETKTLSDSAGRYLFPSLPPGTYMLSAQHEGFESKSISGITLDVYQKADVGITLTVGQAQQTVTVEGAAPLVDVSSASIGTVVNEKSIEDLPLNLRQVGALALVVPGTVDSSGRSFTSATGNGSGFNDSSYSGAGGRSAGNLLLIDGVISRALNNGSFALNPPPEMVKEFKIQNNVYDAAFGISSGTVMNLVTESGSNELHGSAWEYIRNRALDARNFFANQNPEYTRNQFGGALGGPLLKNKLFYFGSYEGLRLAQGQTIQSLVPTDAEKGGDFSSFLTGTTANLCGAGGPANLNFDTGQIFYPNTESTFACPNGSATVLVGTPVPGNKLTAIDPIAQKVLAFYPEPNYSSSQTNLNYVNERPLRRHDDQFIVRVDYSVSAKDNVFGRYLYGNANQTFPGNFNPFNSRQHFLGQNAGGGWTHTFSPTLLNDVRVGYQRDFLSYACETCPRQAGTIESYGIHNLVASSPTVEEVPNFTLNNFATIGDGFPGYYPENLPDTIEQFEDTVTLTHKGHTMVFGGSVDFWQTKGLQDPVQANGYINFNGQYSALAGESTALTGISDLADLEQGYPAYGFFTQNAIITNLVGGRWLALFVQDNIRVNSRLSLEAGLRWEHRRQPMDSHNQLAAFFPLSKTYESGDAYLLTPLPNAANDALCQDSYFVSSSGQCLILSASARYAHGFRGDQVRQVSYGDKHGGFAPRFGLSVRALNSDRIVIHAGAGIFYDTTSTNPLGSFANNNPVSTRTPTYNTAFGAPPPTVNGAATTTADIFLDAPSVPLSQIRAQLMPSPFYHSPTTFSWSMSVQSQLAQNLALEVGYVGNRGDHLDNLHQNGNQPKPGLGDQQPRRPWPDFNTLQYDSYDAYSNYNGLLVKLTKRASHGLSGLVSYTYAKGLDNNGGDSESLTNPQDDNNQNAEYGVADSSLRHTLVVSGTFELPVGKGKAFLNRDGITNVLIGGWETSAIISSHAGFPYTVYSPQDYSNTGSISARPDRVCSGTGSRKRTEWFDLNCFTTTALAAALANGAPRFGNSGRNILTGPRFNESDLSLIKRFAIERFQSEFRAEFFNIFNHPNFYTPNATLGSPTAGQLTGAASPRDIQFGLKLKF